MELHYGNTTDSRIEAQGTSNAYTWYLNQVKDKYGNFYNVVYTENTSTGEIYPAYINYSCYGTTSGDYTIELGYVDRTVPVQTFLSGSQVLISKLLNLITIKYGTTTVGKIQLVYTDMKLTEIIKFGKNNTRLNSTVVYWGSTYSGLAESNKTPILFLPPRIQGDFNDDGRKDLFVLGMLPTNPVTFNGRLFLAHNTGTMIYTSTAQLPTTFQGSPMYAGDYNGDSREDVLLFRLINNTYYLTFLISNGNSFTSIDYTSPFISPSSTYLSGDFNGTGKMDLMIKGSGSFNCIIFEFDFTGGSVSTNLIGQSNVTWGAASISEIKEVPLDINGDGKTDLMVLVNNSSRIYGLQEGSTSM